MTLATPAALARPVTASHAAVGGGRARWGAVLIAVVVSAVSIVLPVIRYLHYDYSSWDLAIFSQAVAGYAHGGLPIATVRGGPGFVLLGDHFSPALAVLAPGWMLFPTPVYLLVSQGMLFGFSAVPITRLAAARLGTGCGLLVGASYGLSWGLQEAAVVDFHEIALAVPLLAFGLCALIERRWWAATSWLLPLVLVKEDLGLTVAAAGLVIATRGPRRLGLALAAAGTAASALEILVLIPASSPAGSYGYWSAFTATAGSGNLLSVMFWPPAKIGTVVLTFGVAGFLCLRSPVALLTVPTLLWRFASGNPTYWGHEWHYNAVLMPIVFVALVDALERSGRRRGRLVARAAPHLPAVVATIAVMGLHSTPVAVLADAATYRLPARAAAAARAVAAVPTGVSVESDIGLMSHLVAGRRLYLAGQTGRVVPDYVVIDATAGWTTPMDAAAADAFVRNEHPGTRYVMIFSGADYYVLRRA